MSFSSIVLQATGESLTPLYEKLTLTNVSTRSLSLELLLVKPFSLCEAAGVHSSVTKQVQISVTHLVVAMINDLGLIRTFA